MQAAHERSQFGIVQIVIILLTLATALIHFYLSFLMRFDLLFTLNGLGYLALLAALFLPVPLLARYRQVVRILLFLYTLLTILLWVFLGDRSTIGYVDKAIEVGLLILLWLDRGRN
jgi:hypothetical protein